jgi:sec-independent protein translocase protein TatA
MMGTGEILVILVVILILFGGKKLPEFAQSLGKGIREFKKACSGEDETTPAAQPIEPSIVVKEASPIIKPNDPSHDHSQEG